MIRDPRKFGVWSGRQCRGTLALCALMVMLMAGPPSPSAERTSSSAMESAPTPGDMSRQPASTGTRSSLPPSQTAPEVLPDPLDTLPNGRGGQWVQPDCPTQGVPRRGPLRRFFDRVEAADVPRSPEQSWLYRPLSAGVFFGAMFGTDLMSDWVSEESGFLGGVRAGWDFDPYWGVELRYALGNVELSDSARAIAQRDYWHEAIPSWFYNDQARFSARNLLDVSLLYYFCGDVRWRPYLLFGVGYASLRFDDALGEHYSHTAVGLPLALGLKYLWSDQFAVRFEANDTIVVGNSGLETVHDVAFTVGLEMRFGGSRRSYWPWNPGDRYW